MFISYDEATLYQLSRIDSLQTDRLYTFHSRLIASVKCIPYFKCTRLLEVLSVLQSC